MLVIVVLPYALFFSLSVMTSCQNFMGCNYHDEVMFENRAMLVLLMSFTLYMWEGNFKAGFSCIHILAKLGSERLEFYQVFDYSHAAKWMVIGTGNGIASMAVAVPKLGKGELTCTCIKDPASARKTQPPTFAD